jgi:hypothetical protein
MRTWLMASGLALAMCSPAFAAPEAFEAPVALVTPEGFCAADASDPVDAIATAVFEKLFESEPGGKLLSFYRFCSVNPVTAGLIAVGEAETFKGSPGTFIRDTCVQFRAVKEVEPRDLEQIITKIDQLARKDLGRRTVPARRKVLKAVLAGGICYAFIQPEGFLKEPALGILSYVPIRNKVLIVLHFSGAGGPSSAGESYRHLQQTIAALQRANP